MVARRGLADAESFLALVRKDAKLRVAIDHAIDDNILAAATKLGKQRGLVFRRADLATAIAARVGLGEFRLTDSATPGQCQTDSGCRTPCLYCKSNMESLLGDIRVTIQTLPRR